MNSPPDSAHDPENLFKINMENDLEESRQLIRKIEEIGEIGHWEVDLATGKNTWSDQLFHLARLNPDTTKPSIELGSSFLHPEDRHLVSEAYTLSLQSGNPTKIEIRIVGPSGELRHLLAEGRIEKNEKGKPVRLLGIFRDITEEKKQQIDLKLLESVVTHTRDAILIAKANPNDFGYLIVYVNEAFTKMTGYTAKEVIGKSPKLLQGPESDRTALKKLGEDLRNRKSSSVEVRNYKKDGTPYWVNLMVSPVLDANGSLTHWVGVEHDITEQKLNETTLLTQKKLIGTTAQIIQSLLEVNDWKGQLNSLLELMGNVLNADRAYFFENFNDKLTGKYCSRQTHEWTNGNVPSRLDHAANQALLLEDHPLFLESASTRTPIVKLTRDTEGDIRGILESQGIKSILQISIILKNQFYGFIGLQDCNQDRIWTADEISFLKSIGTNLTFAIDRKLSEERIKEVLEFRNSILESIGDGFCAIDKDYTVTYWNKVAEKKTGISRAQIVGKSLWEVIEKDKNPAFEENLSKAFATNLPVNFETFDLWLESWLDVNIYPADDSLSFFVKDITERKLAEVQIAETDERLAIISAATNDAIWDWNIETGYHYWGDGFRKLFGIDPEIEGKSPNCWEKRVHPDDYEKVKDNLDNILKTQEFAYFEIEYRFLKEDGSYAFVLDKGSVIRSKNGNPIRLVGAMQDISHRKVYEESLKNLNDELAKSNQELEISNKELEQFAYVASHDLQEPLRMITSFLGLIEKKYNAVLDEKGRQYIHHAVDGATRMRQIILDLLEFSRVGNITESKKWVSSRSLVEEVLLFNQKKIHDKKAKIHIGELPDIFCHSSSLVQLFQNLISNAIKYQMPDSIPEVWIQGEDKGNFWEFSVRDNGIGIEQEYLTKIFIIFQRLHQKEQYSGSGIGLAICKKIAEIYGGKIWVESLYGNGSEFHFTIKK